MLNLLKVLKPYTETGALGEQVNLYGFINPHAFLTKSGDVGVILQVHGVDYECLDGNALDTLTKRLESAFRLFGADFRTYQYLFKRNHETIPHKKYTSPIVNAAIDNRIRYFEHKADSLYSLQVFYIVLFEGFRHKQALLRSLAEFHKHPTEVVAEVRAALSLRKQVAGREIRRFTMGLSNHARRDTTPRFTGCIKRSQTKLNAKADQNFASCSTSN